ncbi:hypothetical protein AB1M95_09765 [Sulfitobacter sp. LCG007]
MTKREQHIDDAEAELDALFAALRADAPDLPDRLAARVLADARAEQGVHLLRGRPADRPPALWQRIRDAVGGWPSLGGLAATVCAGFWIGVSTPTAMPGLDLLFDSELSADSAAAELMDFSGAAWLTEEGMDDAG